jgi:Putative peptidoglycan binding domain
VLTGIWARAAFRPVSYAGAAGAFASTPLGWVLHVVVGNGSPFGTFEHAPVGDRKFSHLWVDKGGRVEEYTRLDMESWAQSAGNATYWSVETEGFPDEPLTSDQLDTLAAWHVYSGVPDVVVDRVGGRGIGTHVMGGAAWGNHSCPGIVRAAQRPEIIRRARILRGITPPASRPPAFPLPAGQYYGTRTRSPHNGFTSSTDRGNIRTWQARMRVRGWTITPDGLFGPETDGVLRQFQHEKGLGVDGLLGVKSWGAAWSLPVT